MKATSLVQYHFIHKTFFSTMSLQCLLKADEFFIYLMIIQVVYTFGFSLVALESALLSGEEMNSKFTTSASSLFF